MESLSSTLNRYDAKFDFVSYIGKLRLHALLLQYSSTLHYTELVVGTSRQCQQHQHLQPCGHYDFLKWFFTQVMHAKS